MNTVVTHMVRSKRPRSHSACRQHYRSEPVGATERKRLPSGLWAFTTHYHCLVCDAYFDTQTVKGKG